MKWFILGLLLTGVLRAEESKIIPVFMEAASMYIDGTSSNLVIRSDIRAALSVLEKNKVDRSILEKHIANKSLNWELREDDKFDKWKNEIPEPASEIPEIAVQAFKLKVIEDSDDWFNDDIYTYFFITDGVIPTGKVTSIYKGIDQGQSFFFNEIDRAIFPLTGVPAKKPENHLIIDYGIIESDGDDTKELQKLSSIIIDIAIAVYSTYDPQTAQILINLRKEIKALAEMLLSLNHDDRLATGTIGYKVSELEEMLKDETYVEVSRKHDGGGDLSKWEYKIYFRFLRK